MTSAWEAGLWGLLGVSMIELNDIFREVRRRNRLPWRTGRQRRERARPTASIYLFATVIRLFIGAGVALAAGASELTTAPWHALLSGIGATLILERATSNIPFDPTLQSLGAVPRSPSLSAVPPVPSEDGVEP